MIEILNGGLSTTVQDYPGRIGYWDVGVPPSGPMDSVAFRIANKLVGNNEDAAALEITAMGPTLKFHEDLVIALSGAKLKSVLNGVEIPWMTAIEVKKGDTLKLGAVIGNGFRAYLSVRGGIDVPKYLGSRATFTFGGFGGHEGRPLKPGDVLRVGKDKNQTEGYELRKHLNFNIEADYSKEWEVGVIPGPHGAPDFFTHGDVEMFYNTAWRVNYNSNRLGYRLEGPSPTFARKDGGEGGRHPSNAYDYTYSIGTINFMGNMPVILTVDGPSLGGFISFATIATAELWKIGQAKPNDTISFKKITIEEGLEIQRQQNRMIEMIPFIRP